MKSAKVLFTFGIALLPLILLAQGGPTRDDFGQTLDRYNAPRAAIAGLAYDDPAHLIWGTNRANPCRLWALNPDNGEVVHDYQIDQQGAANNNADDAIGLGFDHITELLWVNQWNAFGTSSVANLYDRNGRNVAQVRLPRGGHWDFAFDDNWLYGFSEGSDADLNDDRVYRMNRDGGDVTAGPNLRAIANHGRMVAMTFVPQHLEGNFWLMSVGYISQFNINWANGNADLIREFRSNNNDYPHQGLTHDGFNLWGGGNWNSVNVYKYDDGIPEVYGEVGFERETVDFRPTVQGEEDQQVFRILNLAQQEDAIHVLNYAVTDLGGEPDWLGIDPVEGTIEARQSVDITLTASTAGLELGEYHREIMVEANDPMHIETIIPLYIAVVDGRGRISGHITDATDGSALEGVTIASESFGFIQTSDENGFYSFEGIAAWDYTFHVSFGDYLPETRSVEVNPGDDLEVDFSLRHGEFSPRLDSVDVEVPINDSLEYSLTISNPGNGPLHWSSVLDFPDEIEDDPWTLLSTLNISEITGDERIQAVVFADNHFYVAGADAQRKTIYVLSREGEVERSFPQLSQSRYGFSSLTWDGELLWGAGDQIIYGFNTAGDSITSFVGPHEPASSNVVWDSERQLFWLSSATSSFKSCDREGNVQSELNQRRQRTYGLGYFPDDPDGYNLYLYTNPIDSRRVLVKMNTATNDTMTVVELPDDGGRPAGCAISNSYDPHRWIFFGVSNNGINDHIYSHHITPKTNWIDVSPESGDIDAVSAQEITLNFNANYLVPDVAYRTVLRFSHNGFGRVTEVPLTVNVTLEAGMVERDILLDRGWNLISTNVRPVAADNFAGLMEPLVTAGSLILAKDGAGNFYWPDHEFEGIDGWNWQQGYWLKLNSPAVLSIPGEPLPADSPIGLNAGWNTITYVPRTPIPAEVGLSRLEGNLVIARDGRGRFYLPAYNFSDMDRLRMGVGYQVRVNEAAELVYSLGQAASVDVRYSRADAEWIDGLSGGPSQFSLLVISDLPVGTRIEALTPAGIVAGRGVVGSDGNAGVNLWGDDATTEEVEGFVSGEIPLFHTSINEPLDNLKSLEGDIGFTDGGWGVIELKVATLPLEFGISSAYPNPFNAMLSLTFSLQQAGHTKLAAYDLSGREVFVISSGRYSSGTHRVVWNATDLPAGVYIVRLDSEANSAVTKVVLLK